jgi:hypothetical protein
MNKEPDFEEQFESMDSYNNWIICPKGNYPWNKYMGGTPDLHWGVPNNGDKNTSFIRLDCVHHPEDGYVTSGIKSKQTFGDGKIEIRARFKGGNSSWPAIWLKNYKSDKYYEIDLCEYFERRPWCKTGIFMPKHLKKGLKRLFRPKAHPFIKRNDWNTFTCEWDENVIFIYVNDKLVLDYWNTEVNSDRYPQTPEDRQFSLILSMQYDHSWCLPKCKKQLPLYMDIDYVKYWKKDINSVL